MTARPVVLATDFGASSEWVGVCHGVIASIAPQAQIIDLAHDLTPFDVAGAGQILRAALPYFPVCIAVLVVDPGVGSERRGLAAQTGRGDLLVGPDNGLLRAAAADIGGLTGVRHLTESRFHLPNVSKTFHARDIFCPVAAHLCVDAAFEDVGPPVDRNGIVAAWEPRIAVRPGSLVCEVINVDRFGNVRVGARPSVLRDAAIGDDPVWVVSPGREMAAHRAERFADLDAGDLGIIEDSFGYLSLCVNGGNAAEKLGVKLFSAIELRSKAN